MTEKSYREYKYVADNLDQFNLQLNNVIQSK